MTATELFPLDPLARPGRRARAALRIHGARVAVRVAAFGDPFARLVCAGPGDDVYALHERIRARGPLVPSRLGVHVVTARALCEQVLRHPDVGIQDPSGSTARADGITEVAVGPLVGSLIDLDPPDHTRLRRLSAPAFRPRAMRGYARTVETVVHRLLDDMADEDEVDLVGAFASPFPVAVISDLLGVRDADPAHLAHLGAVTGRALDGVASLRHADEVRAAALELADLFVRAADHRRDAPGDDVVSLLAQAEVRGELSRAELVASCSLLLLAGFETTVNLIGNAVALLLADRARWQRLVAEPALAARVVEETLRYDPPVQMTARITHAPVELAGTALPPGTTLLLLLAAANRDPAAYHRPDRFDLDREGGPSTWPSRAASTTASGRRWRVSRPRSPCARSRRDCRACGPPVGPDGAAARPCGGGRATRSRREPEPSGPRPALRPARRPARRPDLRPTP